MLHHEPLGEGGVRVEVLERLGLLLREFLPLPEVLPQEGLHLAGQHLGLAVAAAATGLCPMVMVQRRGGLKQKYTALYYVYLNSRCLSCMNSGKMYLQNLLFCTSRPRLKEIRSALQMFS